MTSHLAPSGSPARRLIGGLLLAAVAVGVVGCSDDADSPASSGNVIDQISDATFAAGSAAISGQTRFADGTSGPIEGASRAEPPAGEVTAPIETATGLQPVTYLWVDDTIYVKRAITTDSILLSATLRLATDPPWNSAAYQPLTTLVFDAYDPFRLLERLASMDVVAEPQGTETVGETDLEKYVIDLSARTVSPASASTVELLTDGDKRLQVVRLVGDGTVEYALSDFGLDVAPTAPPPDQIGSSPARPAIEPVGPYETVAQGGLPTGGSWQLFRAPGTDGGSCWRVDSDPPVDAVAPTGTNGETCISAFDPTASADEQVQVVVDSGKDAPFDLLVAVVAPGSTDVEIQFADKTSQPLVIDPNGFVVWVGPKAPLAVVLEMRAPNGTRVGCGPGPVTTVDDLEVMPPDQVAILDRMPWICLEL